MDNFRRIVFSIAFLLCMAPVIAKPNQQNQQNQQNPQQVKKEKPVSTGDLFSHDVGAYFNYEYFMGSLSHYVSSGMGGGFIYEATFRLPLNLRVGPAAHIGFNYDTTVAEQLTSMMNLSGDIGAVLRVPVMQTGLTICPEVDYGVMAFLPSVDEEYSGSVDIKNIYADMFVKAALGIRFSHEKVLGKKLEFELAPTYTFSLEKTGYTHLVGGRFSVRYCVGGAK